MLWQNKDWQKTFLNMQKEPIKAGLHERQIATYNLKCMKQVSLISRAEATKGIKKVVSHVHHCEFHYQGVSYQSFVSSTVLHNPASD